MGRFREDRVLFFREEVGNEFRVGDRCDSIVNFIVGRGRDR